MTLFSKLASRPTLRNHISSVTATVSHVCGENDLAILADYILMKRQVSGGHSKLLKVKRPRITMATRKIQLTAREEQLRQILLDVSKKINESKVLKEELELRFAGGWVRDKLLGIESNDIDIAINAMTGYPFCQEMRTFLDDESNMKRHSLQSQDLGKLHQVLANPEKSKHLETATTKLLGLDLDFVNLRKETYTQDSRNPIIEFGDARDDALRRDATINALFYNIHSDQVEDFTGGLEDLANKRIRTPLDPLTTFTDDPLRVLRLIRFASRLDFTIDPICEEFMHYPTVLEALKLKISRERVGIEVTKMLKGKNPRSALEIFHRLDLYHTTFSDPDAEVDLVPDASNWRLSYNCLNELRNNSTPGSLDQVLVRSEESRYLAWMLVCFTPWAAITHIIKKGKVKLPAGAMAAREGIKADNKVTALLSGALKQLPEIIALKDAIQRGDASTRERDTVGTMIRRWDLEGNWRLQTLFAVLVEAMTCTSGEYSKLFSEWQAFIDHLESIDVMNVPSERPIVDGSLLVKALGSKGGPWTARAMDVCMAWQLRNPGNHDVDAAIEEVRLRRTELQIPD